MSPEDKAQYAAYFKAASQWDRLRREATRGAINDPAMNRLAYDAMMQQLLVLHGKFPGPRPHDEREEHDLVRRLQVRHADRPGEKTA